MGMSASQMRLITLTGKKSDIEYQGQQINQQRTTLATQSSTLNSNLLNLSVPTPPSPEEYTKVAYTYTSNGTEYAMKAMKYEEDTKTYTLSYSYVTSGPQAKLSGVIPIQKQETGVANEYNYAVSLAGQIMALTKVDLRPDANGKQTEEQLADAANISYLRGIDTLSDLTDEQFYKYKSNGVTKYLSSKELSSLANYIQTNGEPKDLTASTWSTVHTYVVDEDAKYTETGHEKGCTNPIYSDAGRLQSIQTAEGLTLTMTVTTETDTDSYNNAYNEYLYKREEYNKEMENINAQLEVIASQDKKLELKLSDLDTQQKAVSTEIDAVKKVVDKNVESSFKTFA